MEIVYSASSLPRMEILSCPNDRQFMPYLHDGHVLWLYSEVGKHYRIQGNTNILQPESLIHSFKHPPIRNRWVFN